MIHNLDLPRGEERELVVDRDRVYELNSEDSRTLALAHIMIDLALPDVRIH